MPRFIIAKVRLAHCKKGPRACEKCREMDVEKICLLDIDPPNRGMLQRRVMPVEIDGQEVWREYDIVRSFSGVREALDYAAAEGVGDVLL